MADREKVLMGLTCCANLDAWSERVCHKCPYNCDGDGNGGCEDHLIADAFALLKEQEARVMTREEIKSNYVEIFYFETRAGMLRACVKELSDLPDSSIVYLVCGAVDDTYWRDLDGYGITWRAWNRRPTPEQMRDTKWEEMP